MDGLPDGIVPHLGSWNVMAPEAEEPYKIKVTIRMNASGMAYVEAAERVEVYYEEVEVKKPKEEVKKEEAAAAPAEGDSTTAPAEGEAPPAAPAETSPEETVKETKKRTRKIPIEIVPVFENAMAPLLERHIKEERRMKEDDRVIREIAQTKYELESSVYDYRDKLGSKFNEYVEDSDKPALMEMLSSVENWLYDEGQDTIKSVYVEKL
jgi:heat shock protein 4